MSTLPNAFLVSSTRCCRSSFEEMLAGTAMAEPGYLALISAATSSQGPALRDEIVTLAPCSAMRSAMALPIPREDPVMTATLPVRSNSSPMTFPLRLKRSFDQWPPFAGGGDARSSGQLALQPVDESRGGGGHRALGVGDR